MSFAFPFPGPIAPETNPKIEPQWFRPSVFPIVSIAYGISTTVTTGTAFGVSNNYVIGQLVRLEIPFLHGAQQLNGQEAYVIGTPGPNQVVINVNTSKGYDLYKTTTPIPTAPAQIAAIGDINSGPINFGRSGNQTYISGSFQNISPTQPI